MNNRDYMTALRQRFHVKSEQAEKMGREVEVAYDVLHDTLSREQQKLLLRFLDVEEHLRDAESLDAFISGFRLADGIHRELGPPYSYEAENEARAREIIQQEFTPGEQV